MCQPLLIVTTNNCVSCKAFKYEAEWCSVINNSHKAKSWYLILSNRVLHELTLNRQLLPKGYDTSHTKVHVEYLGPDWYLPVDHRHTPKMSCSIGFCLDFARIGRNACNAKIHLTKVGTLQALSEFTLSTQTCHWAALLEAVSMICHISCKSDQCNYPGWGFWYNSNSIHETKPD